MSISLPGEMGGRLLGVLVVGLPFVEQHDAADADGRARELERDAGAARRSDEPAPVGIAAVHGRLHEQRVRNGARRPLGVRPFAVRR